MLNVVCTILFACRAVGIVQQNQIKKARKIQDDIRAEHERLVVGHLTRLRRAAAAEQQADTAAKQVTMSWLQVRRFARRQAVISAVDEDLLMRAGWLCRQTCA